ncbi:hypothetical protein SAMN05216226_11442 [Halovenus aranensis]|uniref:Uncharacterized protein n=2 Tax=Halovenus aranensis TaxID=890420 RepID=A0A1G8YCY3_9EURY|nr:hypothetical protein SAMN05216226_11442 [Halovenus aranensis]
MDVDPRAVAAAVRRTDSASDERIAVDCPEPSPLHDAVGCIRPEMGLRTRTALARAGRTRGLETPYDEELRETRRELDAIAVETEPLESHRERVTEAEAAVEQARIRAAEARGRVRERSESGLDPAPAESELDDALQTLSEAETDAIAARQAYERDRRRQRERRDRRERRFRLEERVANLERQARSHLVDRLRDEFRGVLSRVPGATVTDEPAEPFEVDSVTAALAVAHLGDISAPVVVGIDRFGSAVAASAWLEAPVLYI